MIRTEPTSLREGLHRTESELLAKDISTDGQPGLCAPIVLLLLLFVMLLAPLPESGRAAKALLDAVHAPLFACVFIVVSREASRRSFFPERYHITAVWITVVGFGAVSEMAQALSSRSPSWHDTLANLLGATAGALWVKQGSVPARRRRLLLIGCFGAAIIAAQVGPACVLLDCVRQNRDLPVVASFEGRLELSRWNSDTSRLTRVRQHATDGQWALHVELRDAMYPGVELAWPPRNWSAYHTLVVDIGLDRGFPLDIIVKIKDAEHNNNYDDRYHKTVTAKPGQQRIFIDLREVAAAPRTREMNMSRIASVQFFSLRQHAGRSFYLDNIHLQ